MQRMQRMQRLQRLRRLSPSSTKLHPPRGFVPRGGCSFRDALFTGTNAEMSPVKHDALACRLLYSRGHNAQNT